MYFTFLIEIQPGDVGVAEAHLIEAAAGGHHFLTSLEDLLDDLADVVQKGVDAVDLRAGSAPPQVVELVFAGYGAIFLVGAAVEGGVAEEAGAWFPRFGRGGLGRRGD